MESAAACAFEVGGGFAKRVALAALGRHDVWGHVTEWHRKLGFTDSHSNKRIRVKRNKRVTSEKKNSKLWIHLN